MTEVRDYFEDAKPTNEGFRANCPRCDDKEKKFYFNVEKSVGCCFHADCAWGTTAGGATAYRIRSFFGDRPVLPSYPTEVVEAKKADLKLPKEFTLIEDLPDRLASQLSSYLVGVRGLTSRVVKMARVGYCDSGKMWGYIIFPVFNEDEEVVYWQGRRFKNRSRKFYNPESSKKSQLVYELPSRSHPKRIVLVESVINSLTLIDGKNVCSSKIFALLGKTISDSQMNKVLAWEKDILEIVIALDPDAWRQACDLAKRLCAAAPVKLALFSKGEDMNSIGRMEAWNRIDNALAYRRDRHLETLQAGLRLMKAS